MTEKFITYEMFGAVGDGMADDMPAIVRAHEEANRLHLPVKAREGATYYISPKKATAYVQTSTDWTGAKIIIDDRQCEDLRAPVFELIPSEEPVALDIAALTRGQTELPNPTGRDLYVVAENKNHADYIRKGLNQDNGHPRTDTFVLFADGRISSPISFDFDEITDLYAIPLEQETIFLTGGEFTTIANQAESRYTYHARNIEIRRSNVDVSGFTHLVTGEIDHGAPYRGFISSVRTANVTVHDCVFTAHFIYWTIGSAKLPVAMGSYDINIGHSANITFARCTQTTDIYDNRYWGLMGSNYCRDLTFEDCVFSRFDAHMGVSNCTLRRCKLGWQCLNAIGNGDFLIEEVDAYGRAFISLRGDYGSTWRGQMTIRNSTWHPQSDNRSIIAGHNGGDHYFGYDCYLPDVVIDGLTVVADDAPGTPLYVFNDYTATQRYFGMEKHMPEEIKYPMIPPKTVCVKNISRPVSLCETPALMPDTEYTVE